jgi:TonB dependent receptor
MAKYSLFVFLFTVSNLVAQPSNDSLRNAVLQRISQFSITGHGAMNYYNFNWQTDSVKRNAIDNERFILELKYSWNPKLRLNTEIEFEHGGTGSSVEFDRFEEFGEFEFDISKGGEVLLEQMNLEFRLKKNLQLKVGRVKVPFALMFRRDEPTDYLTCINSEMETQILPENWTENGFLLFGKIGKKQQWQYHFALVNGLDGSAFNSANWIKRGNQRRFEMANAENFAFSTRLDYEPSERVSMGFSLYGGNTTDNRPKPDLRVNTLLGLGEMHFQLKYKVLNINVMALYGALSNSEALSNQNRNLSNNLNVKRTPVGASAFGIFGEMSLKLLGENGLFQKNAKKDCVVYGRYDFYDTMRSTQGQIFNNPRWQRETFTFGLVYKIIEQVHLKAQYSLRKVGAPAPTSINGGRLEKTLVTGFAFEF